MLLLEFRGTEGELSILGLYKEAGHVPCLMLHLWAGAISGVHWNIPEELASFMEKWLLWVSVRGREEKNYPIG